jgi:hypothetical protein
MRRSRLPLPLWDLLRLDCSGFAETRERPLLADCVEEPTGGRGVVRAVELRAADVICIPAQVAGIACGAGMSLASFRRV